MWEFATHGKTLLESLRARAKQQAITVVDSYEEVRLQYPTGWAMLRMSLHDPILPLNIESNSDAGLSMIRQSIASLLAGFDHLDLTDFV